MSRLLFLDLEIDAICWEFIARRIAQLSGTKCPPQPIVTVLDAPPDPDEDWEEVTARAAKYMPEPGRETAIEMVERVISKEEQQRVIDRPENWHLRIAGVRPR